MHAVLKISEVFFQYSAYLLRTISKEFLADDQPLLKHL